MARRKLLIGSKLEASTILEVLISMVAIIAVFGIGMMIFGNVTRASLSEKKIEAQSILQARLLDIEAGNDSLSMTKTENGFQIEQKISAYGSNQRLYQVYLALYDSNQEKIAELEKVIVKPQD